MAIQGCPPQIFGLIIWLPQPSTNKSIRRSGSWFFLQQKRFAFLNTKTNFNKIWNTGTCFKHETVYIALTSKLNLWVNNIRRVNTASNDPSNIVNLVSSRIIIIYKSTVIYLHPLILPHHFGLRGSLITIFIFWDAQCMLRLAGDGRAGWLW